MTDLQPIRNGHLNSCVSLVIPLQDEENTVEALLRSIAAQTTRPKEVIVVDAGSRDETVIRCRAVHIPVPIQVVSAGRVFPGVARNKGVAAATSEWIAFTDGGIVLHRDWLRELVAVAKETTDAVFGNYNPACDSFFRECAALAYVPPRDQHGTRGASVASCLIRRSAFLRLGGFPPFRAAEDLIFLKNLEAAGTVIAHAPRADVRWQLAGGVATTFERFANYSHHNLVAGWGRHWHGGVTRLYLGLTLLAATAYIAGIGAWAWLAAPLFFIARAAKAAWIKRRSFDFRTLSAGHMAGAAALLVIIDAATLAGCFRWLSSRPKAEPVSSAPDDHDPR